MTLEGPLVALALAALGDEGIAGLAGGAILRLDTRGGETRR